MMSLRLPLRVQQHAEVGQRIAVDHQQVGMGALGDDAEHALLHQQLGIDRGRRAHGCRRALSRSRRISNSRSWDFCASGPYRSVPKPIGTLCLRAQP